AVGAQQLGVVVEHLLEVWQAPVAVDAVAEEAAAEMIMQAAGCHGVERAFGHGDGSLVVAVEQQRQDCVRGELGSAAEAAGSVLVASQDRYGRGQLAWHVGDRTGVGAEGTLQRLEMPAQLRSRAGYLFRTLAPRLCQ